MEQIRRGVFETNSSSMHAIAVMRPEGSFAGEDGPDDQRIYVGPDGTWEIGEDELEFHRDPYRLLCSAADKARYAIASLAGPDPSGQDALKEITGAMAPYGVKKIELPADYYPVWKSETAGFLVPAGREYRIHTDPDTGKPAYEADDGSLVPVKRTGESRKITNYGHVDHQSDELLADFLESRPGLTLARFIRERRYIAVIDGDEYNAFGEACARGVFPVDLLEEAYGA